MPKQLFLCLITTCLLVTISVCAARATLIGIEDANHGSHYVLDTDTGLQWLNIRHTSGPYNFNEMMSWLSPGGRFDGWNLASSTQVFDLMVHAGLPGNSSGFNDSTNVYTEAMTNFQSQIGFWTDCTFEYRFTWGIVSDSLSPGSLSSVLLGQNTFSLNGGAPPYYVENFSAGLREITLADFNNICGVFPLGAWVVRPTDTAQTPEPSTFLLVAGSLLCFIVWRCIKKHT